MLFENQKYETSAQRYAETQSNFEEICLKFIQVNQTDALKLYLRSKLDTLKAQDKTQITMIVIWIVEVYLTKLEEKRLQGLEQTAKYDDIQKEFELFLSLEDVSSCIRTNKTTVYDLMASHGDKYNLMKLMIVNKDFEQVCNRRNLCSVFANRNLCNRIFDNSEENSIRIHMWTNHYSLRAKSVWAFIIK